VQRFIPCDVAVDVGANIGNHSLFFRRFVARGVIAVEPYRVVLPSLRANLAGLDAVTVYEVALGTREGHGTIFMPTGNGGNAGLGNVSDRGAGGDIPITTLDALIERWSAEHGDHRIGLVKVDVEGTELDVLKGGERLLKTYHPDLLVETATPSAFDELQAYLSPLGYVPITRWAITPVHHFRHNPTDGYVAEARSYQRRHRLQSGARRVLRALGVRS
jgi:FkbM family methyltransferase